MRDALVQAASRSRTTSEELYFNIVLRHKSLGDLPSIHVRKGGGRRSRMMLIISVFRGLIMAIMVSSLLWHVLKILLHPEYGPWLELAALIALLLLGMRAGQLIAMAIFFLLIAAFVMWPAGAEWRARHPPR